MSKSRTTFEKFLGDVKKRRQAAEEDSQKSEKRAQKLFTEEVEEESLFPKDEIEIDDDMRKYLKGG